MLRSGVELLPLLLLEPEPGVLPAAKVAMRGTLLATGMRTPAGAAHRTEARDIAICSARGTHVRQGPYGVSGLCIQRARIKHYIKTHLRTHDWGYAERSRNEMKDFGACTD